MKNVTKMIAFCAILLNSLASFAQETTSDIQGLVTDGTNPLVGATISAVHEPTGTIYNTTTRKDGHFNLANLRIGGPYTIKVTNVGFKEQTQDNVFLSLGQVFTADFSLKSNAQELADVVVTSSRQSKIFSSGRTGSQEVVSRVQIERLPTINRSLQDFTKLEPTSNGLSFGGRSTQLNNVTVDGANFNNSFGLAGTLGGQTGSQPISLDAIEQIQVNVSPYDVRQGGFSGAGINSVTRSGSNQFKGTFYYYTKNENTQGYQVENTTVTKTPLSFGLLGGALGGAIIKNKLFFFVSYEQVRQELPATSFVASDATRPVAAGSVSQANADSLNVLAAFLKTKFNYDPGPFQGYAQKTESDKVTVKVDWNIDGHNTLTVKYNYLKSFSNIFASTSRNGFSGFLTGGQPGNFSMPFQGSGYTINNNFDIFIAELNTRFSNKAVNKLQVGYTALRDFRAPQSTSSTTLPLVDIINNGNIYTTFGYEPFTYNNVLNTDVFQISDIFTFFKGKHEITVGTQNFIRSYKNGFAPAYQGVYQFNSLSDFYNSVNNGTSAARYALQYSALPNGAFPFASSGVTEIGVFAQDKWRVNKTFTLTYGLRLDYSSYTGTFDANPNFAALAFPGGKTYDVGKQPDAAPLISPRLGFNWDAMGDQTLQIRGGAGIFAGPPPFVWISNQASNNGVQFGSIVRTTGVPFKADPDAYRPAAGAANTSYGINITDKNFKYPQVLKTSLAIDKKFKNDWIVTLEASYTKDINAVYYVNRNLNQDLTQAIQFAGPDNRYRYAATPGSNRAVFYGAGGATVTNPNITTMILMSNTDKGYSYNVTGRVQKTVKDFYFSLAYTYAQSQNAAEGGSTAGGLWSGRAVQGDPNTPNLAFASWNLPHRIVGFASYKFTYAKYLATSFGVFFEAAPGGVTSYTYSNDLNNDGNTNDLLYIPRSASEIVLVKAGSGGLGTGASTDPRTPGQIWAQLNNFINQDAYLSSRRGQVAEANAVSLPFFSKFDVNITQDFSVKAGKDRHTLRLSFDILNVGNLLNGDWGLVKVPTKTNFLTYEGLGADGKTPSFSFPYLDAANQVPLVNSFSNSTGIGSRWQMQIGVRYLFN